MHLKIKQKSPKFFQSGMMVYKVIPVNEVYPTGKIESAVNYGIVKPRKIDVCQDYVFDNGE